MKHKIGYSLLALALCTTLSLSAQAGENSAGKPAAEVPGIPAGTVITPTSARVIAQDAYLWGWPLVNAFNRRASF